MLFGRPFFITVFLIIAFSSSASVRAGDPTVSIITASPAALAELNQHLPNALSQRLGEMAMQYAGPFSTAVSLDSPAGVWLNWHDGLPRPILLLKDFDQDAFKQIVESKGLVIESRGDGISELALASPVFFRESNGWFFLASSADDLREVADPLAGMDGDVVHTLAARVQLGRVPASARTEIAKVIATRLLPPAISEANAIDADGLIHLYSSRLINDLTTQSETILVTVDSESDGLTFHADVEGPKISRLVQKAPKVALPGANDFTNGFRLHSSLRDEEVALLMWWAKSLPEQVNGAFESATIEDRQGKQAIFEAVQILADAIGKTAVLGEVEAFGTLVGPELETPLVGVRVHSGQWVDEKLNQWINAGHAGELHVGGVELNFETVQDVRLHRFTLAESDAEMVTVTVGIGTDRVFLTSGNEGLSALRDMLNQQASGTEIPSPLQLRLNDVSVASVLGWVGQDEVQGRLELTSDYTDRGVHYEVKFLTQK